MKLLDLSLPTPAENLACDEALLDWREEESGGEILRFWEPREYFVVVGYANKVASEANVPACATDAIPILRRCSGGGAVLQGPGCLNYSLILKITEGSPLTGINSANRFIMERNRAALEKLFLDAGRGQPDTRTVSSPSPRPSGEKAGVRGTELEIKCLLSPALASFEGAAGVEPASVPNSSSAHSQPSTLDSQLRIQGHTDLALGTLKFSGNAQRRKKRCLLFHGTFLLRFDISLVEKFLQLPAKQPDYRQNRAHSDFLTNLDLPAESLKGALRKAWQADEPFKKLPRERIKSLSCDKYVTKEWNFKF
jgi:lipoate-protein ligase A